MQWCKLHNNFRNTPAMKSIAKGMGERGVAAAYRLLEVMTERCGSGERYNPTLVLEPPCDADWLAGELFIPDPLEPYDGGITADEVLKCLDGFASNGLIYLGEESRTRIFRNATTKRDEPRSVRYPSITLIDFEEHLDEWTERKRSAIQKVMAESGKKRITLGTQK